MQPWLKGKHLLLRGLLLVLLLTIIGEFIGSFRLISFVVPTWIDSQGFWSSHFSTVPASSSSSSSTTTTKKYYDSNNQGRLCTRACSKNHHHHHHQPTIVLWYSNPNVAGLDDRRQVLLSLANVARYLCAHLVIPSPRDMLDASRHFTTVSPKLQWIDLINVTYSEDTKTFPAWTEIRSVEELYNQILYDHHPYEKKISNTPEEFLFHYEIMESFLTADADAGAITAAVGTRNARENKSIRYQLWEIRISWHGVKHMFQEYLTTRHSNGSMNSIIPALLTRNTLDDSGKQPSSSSSSLSMMMTTTTTTTTTSSLSCWYIQDDIPYPMQHIVHQVWQEVTLANPPHSLIGLLHIRRGDSTSRCNTTVAKMKSYLSCSLRGITPNSSKTIVLLLATDENDHTYRQSIIQILMDLSCQVLDLDALVNRKVEEAIQNHTLSSAYRTNYYIYRIQTILKVRYVDFVLQQRQRHDCLDCQPIFVTKQ